VESPSKKRLAPPALRQQIHCGSKDNYLAMELRGKGALPRFTRDLARELAGSNTRVNASPQV
jgi:hypothetical protein